MTEAFKAERRQAQDALQLGQIFQQKYYNQGRIPLALKGGDKVLINPHMLHILRKEKGKNTRDLGKKLLMRYEGPFEVMEKISPVAYRIRLPASYKIHPIINVEHLEKYHDSPEKFGQCPKKCLHRTDFDELPEMEVEKIVDESFRYGRRHDGKRKQYPIYRVREFRNAPEILREWKVSRLT